MPAYRERIYIIPSENGKPVWIGDFPYWWDRVAFFEKFSQRQIDTGNPMYVDYGLLLIGWEAADWDRRSKQQFSNDSRSQDLFLRKTPRLSRCCFDQPAGLLSNHTNGSPA